MKRRKLIVVGSAAIVVGSLLLFVFAPVVALMGIPTSGEGPQGDFFRAYPFLSGSYPIANVSSTFWLSFAIGITGLAALIAGVVLIILVFTKNYLVSYH